MVGGLALAGALLGQEIPNVQEEVVVRWWIVPIYALNADGTAVRDLKAEDLAIRVAGVPVEKFTLHKKTFRSAAAAEPTQEALRPPLQRKLVVLAFDAAFTSYNLLSRAKDIASEMLARSEEDADYLVLSIEPYAGLTRILGPDRDPAAAMDAVGKYVVGKKSDYLRSSDLDSTSIRNPYPTNDKRNPEESIRDRFNRDMLGKQDERDVRRKTANFVSALMTLNVALTGFRDATRVVYLFSGGPPAGALEVKGEVRASEDFAVVDFVNVGADVLHYGWLEMVARRFNENGTILLAVNPAGTRVDVKDRDSGESALRLLAEGSGGRYFEGAEKSIARDVVRMENGYYEVSFPDSKAYAGNSLELTAASRRPGMSVFSVRRMGREKNYAQLTRFEKEVLVLSLLREGGFDPGILRPMEMAVAPVEEKTRVVFPLTLPLGVNDRWDVYKVWRHRDTGEIAMEKDDLTTATAETRIFMTRRKDFREDVVLVHPGTAVALVCRGK